MEDLKVTDIVWRDKEKGLALDREKLEKYIEELVKQGETHIEKTWITKKIVIAAMNARNKK